MWRKATASVVAAVLSCGGSAMARAQAAAAPGSVRVERYAHRLTLDTTHIHAGRFTYRLSLVRDSVVSFVADQQVAVAETQYAGAAAWLLTQSGDQGVSTATDSLIVSRSDLRPLHWSAAHGLARLAAEFTPDTIFGAMSSPLGRQNIVLGNRADLLVNTVATDMVLAALPLSREWRDSASVLVIDAGGAVTAAATLAVDGEERLTLPTAEYDCWIVSLESERGAARYWVAKDSRLVVRSEQVLPQLGGAVLARELVYVDAAPSPPPPPTPPR